MRWESLGQRVEVLHGVGVSGSACRSITWGGSLWVSVSKYYMGWESLGQRDEVLHGVGVSGSACRSIT